MKWHVLIVFLFLISCSQQSALEKGGTDTMLETKRTLAAKPNQTSTQDNIKSHYHFGAGENIRISVYGEPDLSLRAKISPKGLLNFPYIHEVQVIGKTPNMLEKEIQERLKGDYLINPIVTVTIENFRPFFIFGEVQDPNAYEYQPGLNVMKAISMSGGFTDRADRTSIDVRHANSNELIKNVNYNFPITPGDTVIIEQSFF